MIRYRVFDGAEMKYPPVAEYPFIKFFVDGGGKVWEICRVCGNGEVGIQQTDAIAMLSTGLKDKNDKEVWVGDIVSICPEDDDEYYQGEVQRVGLHVCIWTPEEWVYDISEAVRGEVIGNVYEEK